MARTPLGRKEISSRPQASDHFNIHNPNQSEKLEGDISDIRANWKETNRLHTNTGFESNKLKRDQSPMPKLWMQTYCHKIRQCKGYVTVL